MSKKETVKRLLSQKATRIALCERSFFYFCLYYFSDAMSYPCADYHKEYIKHMQEGESILFNGFRECAKTVYAKYYMIRCIVYTRKRYMVFFCDEKKKAVDKIIDVAGHLQTNKKIISDFGKLFNDPSLDNERSSKKRMGDFETTNNVRVEAMGMGEVFRGKVYGVPGLGEKRPDLVILDDIDTQKSTNTEQQVNKGYQYYNNEIMGGLSDNGQVIFLYNTIKEDGVGPRLYQKENNFHKMRVPMIDDSFDPETITRPQRYTVQDIKKKKENTSDIAFAQNYLLKPYLGGQSIVRKERCRILDGYIPKEFERIQIGVDPAISKKDTSDAFAIVVAGLLNNNRYILQSIALHGDDKANGLSLIKSLYDSYKANVVNVETVAFQAIVMTELQEMNIACDAVNTHKDKVTRLSERQLKFQRGEYIFCPGTEGVIDQLVSFPNGRYDDLVDAMMFATIEQETVFFF